MIINNKKFTLLREIKTFIFHCKNTNLKMLFKFLTSRIYEIFFLNNHEENEFENFVKNKRLKFSKNWFLSNLNIFKKYLKNNPNNILEIGTYEGLVAIWFSKNFPNSKIYAVDPLIQDLSTNKERVETEQINNLNINLDIIKRENIIFEKKTSDSFFLNNKLSFDIIYIDGLHTYEACTKDLLNSFKFLNVEGYMMIDDVRLDVYPNKLNVINAIKNFVDCYNNYIDIIFFGWNVIVIKKKREIDF